MTTDEAAKMFAAYPPGTPVVIRWEVAGQEFISIEAKAVRMCRTRHGTYCRFTANQLQDRNNTLVIVIS